MSQVVKDTIYKVIIYRVDNQHLEAFESDDVKAVKTVYEGLDLEWVNSTAEKRPFRHPTEMHSFAPSLISEIKVESMSLEEYQKQNNPYHQQMHRGGFSSVMNQNFNKGF